MRCWGITTGQAGMIAQVRALAAALKIIPEMKQIQLRKPFSYLPNVAFATPLRHLIPKIITSDSDLLSPPYPDLVISCGRRAALVAMGLRSVILTPHLLRGKDPQPLAGDPSAAPQHDRPKFIHIQDPQISPRYFDLVIAMQHDKITGANVIKTRYALHNITEPMLQQARERFEPAFVDYPKPYIAVLLGGSTNKYTLSEAGMRQLIAALQQLLASNAGSLLITPSRRTGEANMRLLRDAFAGNSRVYIYDFIAENPYGGMLALADTIIVTNDSVNMMSEAHATGKPLYILPLPGHIHTKPADFAQSLIDEGSARRLGDSLERWEYAVSDEMSQLAQQVRQRLQLP